jgi:cation/acetate symporter
MAGMFEHGAKTDSASTASFKSQLNKVYGWYAGGFIAFVLVLAVLEQMGLPKSWIGFIFLLATIGLYAGIGIMSRTTRPSTTWPAAACPRCTTAWPPAPTG